MLDAFPPSTVAPTSEPTQVIPFKEVSDETGLAACPDLIRAVVRDLQTGYAVESRPAAAVALHVAATAIGGVASVNSGSRQILPGFNLVLPLQRGRFPGWFNFLISPLTDQIFEMQKSLIQKGRQAVEQDVIIHQEMVQGAMQCVNPDPELIRVAEDDTRRLGAILRPAVIHNRMEAGFLERVLEHSFDSTVLLTDLAGDPVESLVLLKTADRRQLARLLNLSWDGLPLGFGIHTTPGALSALWRTYQGNLLPLFECEEITGGSTPAPLLCIRSPANGVRPNASKIQNAAWKQAIEVLFRMRCAQRYRECRLSENAESRLRAFEVKISGLSLGEQSARQITWLPALARRFALVFWLFDPKSRGSEIGPEYAANAVTVADWLGFEHLAVVQSFADCGANRPPADRTAIADDSDPAEVMLRKIRQKAPVSQRELWRSYAQPKAVWFHEILGALLKAGKVVENGTGCLVAT